MDQPKLERLLRLLKLLTANTTYNVDQLAERLQMSRRTVYRYIDTFREAGFVIKKSGDCIRLDKESPHFRDISQLVHFTEEEAVILKNAIENIDDTNMLKQNLKRKLYSVYDNKTLADTVVRGKNAPNIRRLIEAIEHPGKPFTIGVQWHPEFLGTRNSMNLLFERFVDACQEESQHKKEKRANIAIDRIHTGFVWPQVSFIDRQPKITN